ncbi:MAG: oxidoreductase [Gammaproteobacteria bacterium CG11_big_fil_rev_8_21_14_0_20_46_22]|nr:MAG: oxidoreductase [Gammaproteobacteria bacterium CG12_big_fil_rev_8_21_14_0_65_46_12]PIR10574.1 MAG: oxidoreductase [Gammaproteobacteria bacterium CG11_big_fil_rev_8_21_14_0_20_46_22]
MKKPLVIITGASSGIGQQTAIRFSEAGYPLLLLGRNVESLEAMQLPNAMVKAVDVTDAQALNAAIKAAEAEYGPADALLNIAGVMLLGDVATQDANEWQVMMNVNVMGVLNGMQAVLPGMKTRRHGTIMNVSSIAGIKPFPNHAAYTGSKFAVRGLTDNVREEVAPHNVRVISICPGAVETPLLSHTSSDKIKSDYQAWKKEMGGVLSPDDVARTMLFAYEQPQSVNLREIVLATTKQAA